MSEHLLIEQLRVLSKQHPHIQDDNLLFMKHYHSHRNNSKYLQLLKEGFTHAFNHSAADFFLCGQYLTYLVHFQPSVGQEMEEQRDKYVRAALAEANSNEAALKLVAQLLIREGHFLLVQLKLEMEESNQKNLKTSSIQLLVRLIEEKLKWQHSQLQVSLMVPEGSAKFMKQFSDFLKEKTVNNGELLLQCRIKLLIALIMHQGKQVDHQLKYSVLSCLGYRILSEELRWNLMKLIRISISIFKITGNESVTAFVVQNMRHLWQIEYLQLLFSYITQNGQSCNRQMLLSLLRGLYSTLLQSQHIQDFYLINRKICDIIILISRIGKFDFSKNVANLISTVKKPMLHAPILISIMFIYQQKVQSEVLQAFSVPLHEMFKNKAEYSNYEEVLDYYSLTNFCIDNLMTNPEQYDTFLWHMLALRVTFTTNLPSLLQNNRVYRLLPNLFSCLFLNVHPEYVTEVIDRLLDVQLQLCRQSLEEISVTQILLTVTPLLEMSMPSVNSLQLFYDSLNKLHKQFCLKEMISGEMFLEVSGYLQVMSKYTPSFEIQRVMADILLLCLPSKLEFCHAENILGAMNLFKDALSVQPNLPIMKVYVNLISRSACIDGIRQQSISDRQEVERLLDLTSGGEDEGLKDCYHIQHYILNRGQYDRNHLYNCWVILLQTPNPHQTSLSFYILDLFRYFAECLSQGNVTPICINTSLPEYLQSQIGNILRMLDRLERRLTDVFVIQQIIQLLTLRQALLLYLYQVLRNMLNFGPCITFNQVSEYVEMRCSEMQGDKLISKLKSQRLAPIRQLWCNCSFLLVLMVPLLLKLRDIKASSHLQDRIIAVERDCEWLRQIMGSEHEKAANRYYLVLASHISQLNQTSTA